MCAKLSGLALWLPVAAVVAAAMLSSACSHAPLQPWQREYLSKRAMSFDDRLEGRYRQHMFSTREGADGGYGTVGGGCGCN